MGEYNLSPMLSYYMASNPYNSDLFGGIFGTYVNNLYGNPTTSAINLGAGLLNYGTSQSDSPWVRGVGASAASTASRLGNLVGKIGENINNIGKFKDLANRSIEASKLAEITRTPEVMNDATKVYKAAKAALALSKASKMNISGMTMGIVGEGLSAAFGKSKEYNGRYGGITLGMDLAYDGIESALGFVPGVGSVISGAMALNKGLSNAFGSTDGMTKTDAILGSSFTPFFIKWANTIGMKRTNTFNNLSWQNTELTSDFMKNSYGNLEDVFERARNEAGKNYGNFSRNAYRRALRRLSRANNAWDDILSLAHQNEYLKIRSEEMASINAQNYELDINGGWNPIYRGKLGMKLLSKASNDSMGNYGMRILSAAALI